MKRLALLLPFLLLPAAAFGYPNGPTHYLTDTGPFCASCHSAVKAEYAPEFPPEAAKQELPENKHYGLIRMNAQPSPYMELTNEQKEKIINDAKLIDSKSSVSLSAPQRVKAGREMTVTIKARGGNGPSIGVMLVDRALRYQSRPVAADGWMIAGEPEVKGQDGKVQRTWLDRRIKTLPRNLNFVLVEEQRFDPGKDVFPEGVVTYTLKAPERPGTYTLAAAFLYGTENTDRAGFFQRPSGRILFSEEIKVQVE